NTSTMSQISLFLVLVLTAIVAADSKPPASICKTAGFFSNPGSCTAFHRCVDWTGKGTRFSIFHFNCPIGTLFDESLSICNHAYAVDKSKCTSTQDAVVDVSTLATTASPVVPNDQVVETPKTSWNRKDSKPPASICKTAGFFSNPGSCTAFHRCVDRTGKGTRFSIFHFNCPAGTLFDESLSICNHAYAVDKSKCTSTKDAVVDVS
ncbi:unnamed protein product, partial [Meganyctiphanes norvegica]